MKRVKQKLLSLLLVCAMLCSMPAAAFAADTAAAAGDNSDVTVFAGDDSDSSDENGDDGENNDDENNGGDEEHTHKWSSWKTTTPATCQEDGERTRTCSICGETETGTVAKTPTKHTWDKGTVTKKATCSATGVRTYTCTIDNCTATKTEVIEKDPKSHTYVNGVCEDCGEEDPNYSPSVAVTGVTLSRSTESVNVGKTVSLTATVAPSNATDKTVTWTSSNPSVATVTSAGKVTGVKAGETTITVTTKDGGKTASCKVTVLASETGLTLSVSRYDPTSSSVSLSYNSSTSARTFEVDYTAKLDGRDVSNSSSLDVDYDWSLRTSSSSTKEIDSGTRASFVVDADDIDYYDSLYLSCTVTAGYPGEKDVSRTVSWTINGSSSSSSDFTVSATVYSDSKSYYLVDKDDDNKTSIVDQIENKMGSKEYIDYIRFSKTTSSYGDLNASTSRDYYYESSSSSRYDLDDVYFTPEKTGTASFDCTVWSTKDNRYYVTVNLKVVKDGSSASDDDIVYTAKAGNEVDFKVRDFEDWWDDLYSNGELDYVVFSSPSRGTLYEDYNSSKDTGTKITSSTKCYADPSRSQTDLGDLTYVPNSSTSTSSVTISFTAYGYDKNDKSRSEKGTVYIDYGDSSSSKTAKDISYKTTGTSGVNFSSSDFTSVYRDAVGSSSSTLTIRFTSLPSSGTITYEPSSRSKVTLSSSNMRSYDFSASSSATYRISDLVYTPNSNVNITNDKAVYDCYSGSTKRFSGTVVFSSTAVNTVVNNVTVNYSTTGSSVTFSPSDFYTNKGSAMLSASYLTFGTPSSGTLYAGNAVATTGTKYSYIANTAGTQYLGSLSYRPAANYSGTATISFTAYNVNGTQAAAGTVNILVASSSAAAAPPTPSTSTTPSTGKTFSDVQSGAWYYSDVTALAAAGIVEGRNDGKFYPQDTVNYGEALKLILLAAGAPKQTELPNAAWATNYLNYAVSNGVLSGSASDYSLSAAINRNAIAEMAAKALKLSQASGTSPYADTTDGYVLALTNAGIVQGDSSSGTRLWKGGDSLTRAEISTIVHNIYKYRNVTPGTSTPTTDPTFDATKPDWLK